MFTITYPRILKAARFAEDASKLFDFWPGLPGEGAFSPAVDLREDKDGLTVKLEIPGIDSKELSITAESGWLRVEGKRPAEEGEYILREGSYGEFKREVKLPDWADAEKAEASLALGVLSLRIPRKEETKPRTISISAA